MDEASKKLISLTKSSLHELKSEVRNFSHERRSHQYFETTQQILAILETIIESEHKCELNSLRNSLVASHELRLNKKKQTADKVLNFLYETGFVGSYEYATYLLKEIEESQVSLNRHDVYHVLGECNDTGSKTKQESKKIKRLKKLYQKHR